MATRTRTRGVQQTLYKNVTYKTIRKTTGAVVSSGNATSTISYVSKMDRIVDVTGSPKALHDCSNESFKPTLPGDVGKTLTLRGTYSGNPALYWTDIETVNPICAYLYDHVGHLGTLSGIKALAIARVPAYSLAEVQGFIALAEAREIVNSAAAKAAFGLGTYAIAIARSAAGGGLKKRLSREAKRLLRDLVRRKPEDAKDLFLGILAGVRGLNAYNMEWKYAWRPLVETLQDVNSAVKTLEDMHTRLVKGVRVYGRAKDVRSASVADEAYPVGRWGQNWKFRGTKSTTTTAVASIVRSLNPASSCYNVGWFNELDVVMEVNGLNPSPKRIWQLMPLTFISDWFFNVGNLLESLETLTGPVGSSFTSHSGMYSEKRVTTVTGQCSGRSDTSEEYTSQGSCVKTTYSRALDPLTGGPVLYIPPLTLPTQASKWWSMAQIIFQSSTGKIH